jgi:dihydroflavonol-4-reductase
MRVFVTGATGFIGHNTVKRLKESGHECICLVRNTSKREILEDTACQFVTGDITDKDSLINGMDGCEALVNLANIYSYWEPDFSIYKEVNVDGTRNVMEAALEVGIKKVIHISSFVIWGRTSDVSFNEDSPIGRHTSEYARTKYAGDTIAWNIYENKGLPLVVIYPCGVIGAGDTKSSGDYVKRLIKRKLPIRGLESIVLTWVHVKDVAESICRALEKEGNIGEKYLIGKEQLSFKQFNKLVSEFSGVPLPLISIPNFMLKVNAFFLTVLANITKKPPLWGLSMDSIRNLCMQLRADGSKAERELGINYTPIRKAIEECVESFQSSI